MIPVSKRSLPTVHRHDQPEGTVGECGPDVKISACAFEGRRLRKAIHNGEGRAPVSAGRRKRMRGGRDLHGDTRRGA
jgi:hypothetical protein